MFILRRSSKKHTYNSLPDDTRELHHTSIEETGSSVLEDRNIISVCTICDSLQPRFDDKYYSKNNIWYFHRADRISVVTLLDYPTIHSLLVAKFYND